MNDTMNGKALVKGNGKGLNNNSGEIDDLIREEYFYIEENVEGDNWVNTIYVPIVLPPDPSVCFAMGLDWGTAADEVWPETSGNGQTMLRLWWD